MATCKNNRCGKKLAKGQTKYCSRECRTVHKTAAEVSRRKHKKVDDPLLEIRITGRGQFDYEGNQ